MVPLCLIANSIAILAAQTLTIIVISRQLEEFFFVLCELSFSSSSSSEPLQKWCRVLYYERETPATVKRRVNWVCLWSFRPWFENSRKKILEMLTSSKSCGFWQNVRVQDIIQLKDIINWPVVTSITNSRKKKKKMYST